ncbi:hypothetical protein FANTH_14001 [Fusarium anthophilum]|uniref:Uncharacterized protein n=1 Tax=Fusarium anthophilum TaxID=48485 RepID=A0A8H4YLE7_9HYPO|nr:hypothetical protein FANTH_14001 [Fusarium anthophilum]
MAGWLDIPRARPGAMLYLEGPPVDGTLRVEACSHNITVSFGSYPANKNTGPLGFDAMCQLLFKEDKKSVKTYHLLNLISGGLPTVLESVESSHDTPWVVRPAIFSFHVQSTIPISEAAINPSAIVKDPKALQVLGINGDVTKIPHVSSSGSNDLKSGDVVAVLISASFLTARPCLRKSAVEPAGKALATHSPTLFEKNSAIELIGSKISRRAPKKA